MKALYFSVGFGLVTLAFGFGVTYYPWASITGLFAAAMAFLGYSLGRTLDEE